MDQLIPGLQVLLGALAPAFRQEVHGLFCQMVAAWIVCLGRRSISRVWETTGQAEQRNHAAAFRLFSQAAWERTTRCTAATHPRYQASRVHAWHSSNALNPMFPHLGQIGPSGWRVEMTAQVSIEQQLAMACRPARGHLGHLVTPSQAWENGRKLRKCSHQSVVRNGIMVKARTGGLVFSLTLTYPETARQRERFGIRTQYAWMRQTHVHDKRISQNTYPTHLIFHYIMNLRILYLTDSD